MLPSECQLRGLCDLGFRRPCGGAAWQWLTESFQPLVIPDGNLGNRGPTCFLERPL